DVAETQPHGRSLRHRFLHLVLPRLCLVLAVALSKPVLRTGRSCLHLHARLVRKSLDRYFLAGSTVVEHVVLNRKIAIRLQPLAMRDHIVEMETEVLTNQLMEPVQVAVANRRLDDDLRPRAAKKDGSNSEWQIEPFDLRLQLRHGVADGLAEMPLDP